MKVQRLFVIVQLAINTNMSPILSARYTGILVPSTATTGIWTVASCPESVREALLLPMISIRLDAIVPLAVIILFDPVYVSAG